MLLTNMTYIGKVNYRGTIYPGEHPAIVDAAAWNDVNQDVQTRKRISGFPPQKQKPALLAGLLFCNSCDQPVIATYSVK